MEKNLNEDEMFEITDDFIVAGMTLGGGINYAQLKLLGVSIPPKTGWKNSIIGKKISRSIAKQYIELKGKTKRVTRKESIELITNELFENELSIYEIDKMTIIHCIETAYTYYCKIGDETNRLITKKLYSKLLEIRDKTLKNGTFSQPLKF